MFSGLNYKNRFINESNLTNYKSPIPTYSQPTDVFKVIRIIDGDTIEIEGGKKVRLIGIDAPEINNGKEADCYANEAKNYLNNLLNGTKINLEKDISETDRYGRLVRYIYLDKVFINEKLVRDGFALVSTYPPDIKYQDKLIEAEKYARSNNLGLWNVCKKGLKMPLKTEVPISNSEIKANKKAINCSTNFYNCSDFKSQTEAQEVFDYCLSITGYDVHKLDKDGDKKVCETLP